MPPRKRSSTATDGNGPSKRARSGSADEQGSNGTTASPSASNFAASPPAAAAAAPPPRPKRFSTISATANAWQTWRGFIARNPDYAYSFMCLCKLPHEQNGYDSEEEEGGDEEAEESEGDECPGEGERPRCSRGKACLCHRSVANRPNHKISVSCAGYKLLAYQMSLASVRSPDNFGMYTFNDHAAYGLIEVVENVFADFDLFGDSWRDRWALCEAAVMFLLSDASAEIFMVDDPDKLEQMFKLLGCMFLTMLQHLDREGLLSPTSPIANLGLVMGLYMQLFESVNSGYGLLEEDMHNSEVIGGFVMLKGTILSYSRKSNVKIRGADVLENLIRELDEIDDLEIPEGDDPWDWKGQLEQYGSEVEGELGGDQWDITTWKPKERKDAAFNKKDPLSRDMINHIKSGSLMQLA